MRISFSMKLKNLIIDIACEFSFNNISQNFSFRLVLGLKWNSCKNFSIEAVDFTNF